MTIPEARDRLKDDLAELGILREPSKPPKKAIPRPVATETKPAPKPVSVTELCPEDRVRLGLDCATNAAQYSEAGSETQHRAAAILLEFAEKLLYP